MKPIQLEKKTTVQLLQKFMFCNHNSNACFMRFYSLVLHDKIFSAMSINESIMNKSHKYTKRIYKTVAK